MYQDQDEEGWRRRQSQPSLVMRVRHESTHVTLQFDWGTREHGVISVGMEMAKKYVRKLGFSGEVYIEDNGMTVVLRRKIGKRRLARLLRTLNNQQAVRVNWAHWEWERRLLAIAKLAGLPVDVVRDSDCVIIGPFAAIAVQVREAVY